MTTDDRLSVRASTRLVIALTATAALAAACGGSSSGGTTGSNGSTDGGASPHLRFAFSQVTGKVASVGPNGVAVTTSSGTHNVAFASSTQFSRLATISRSAVAAGDCVSISRPSASSSAAAGASTVTATAVTVTSTSRCAAPTFGAGRGIRPSPPSGLPSGAPTAPPATGGSAAPFGSGGRPGGARFAATVTGTITAVTGSTIVVKPSFGSPPHVTAMTSGSTTYRKRASSTASDATKGTCLTAVGRSASDALDAFGVTLSAPTNGRCEALGVGFGGGFGFGRPGVGGPGGPPSGSGPADA